MGQALKEWLGWSTSGGQRSSKENYIMEDTLHGEGIEKSREKHCSNQESNL